MAKRYRSLRRGQKMFGGRIVFVDHLFPQRNAPPCDDPELIRWLESNPGFGKSITLYDDTEDVPVVDPASIPEGSDVSAEALSAAMVQLKRMGMDVNPALLQKPVETEETLDDEEEGEQIVNTLPTLTYVAQANKEGLQEIVQKQGWDDINQEGTVSYLRDAIREKIKEAQ